MNPSFDMTHLKRGGTIMNPSVAFLNDGISVMARYTYDFMWKNDVIYADKSSVGFRVKTTKSSTNRRALVDGRLFVWKDKRYYIAHTTLRSEWKFRMVLGCLDKPNYEVFLEYKNMMGDHKNWAPIVRDNELFFVTNHYPLHIVKYDEQHKSCKIHHSRSIFSTRYPIRGSTPYISVNDHYIGVVHSTLKDHTYRHAFVKLDAKNFSIARMSPWWRFQKWNQENIHFVNGLAAITNETLVMSFGIADRRSYMVNISLEDIYRHLKQPTNFLVDTPNVVSIP